MTMAAILATILTAALTAFNVAVADPLTDCNDSPDPATQIRGCTKYINEGKPEKHNLSIAYVNRAIAHSILGKNDNALKDFSSAIDIDPDNPLAYYNRGNLYLDTRRQDLAISDFTCALAIDPMFALAYYNRGLAYEQIDKRQEARADFEQALALNPTHNDAKKHLDELGMIN